MKRLLSPLFALAFAAPLWAQDVDDGSSVILPDQRLTREEFCAIAPNGTEGCPDASAENPDADNGPPADAISDLLELLDAPDDEPEFTPSDPSVSARPQTDPCDLAPDLPALVDCGTDESDAPDGDDDAPGLEGILRLDNAPEAATDTDEADEETSTTAEGDESDGPVSDEAETIDDANDSSIDEDGEGPSSDGAETSSGDDDEAEGDEAAAPEATDGADDADSGDAGAGDGTDSTDDAVESEADEAPVAEPAETATYSLSTSTPFLTSNEYLAVRPESSGEALQLVWSVQRETVDGEAVGEPATRTLIISPSFVRDESEDDVSIYDFLTSRHLVINVDDDTMTNNAFEAEVRRRLDTYLGLSQGGRLDDIPLGPDTSFERFWLEAAMGIRREPVTLVREYDAGSLTVQRDGELIILSANFDIGDSDTPAATEISEEDAEAEAQSELDSINLAATPIDFSSDESMVFDPSQAASPINLNLNDDSVAYPDGDPAEQAQAELLRRWMRHALPIHPDALSALEGAPRIPDEFAFFVVSPESPAGRREVWALQSIETVESGFRLEDDLVPAFNGPGLIGGRFIPAAIAAMEGNETDTQQRFLDEIETHRAAGDLVRAYLVSIQEQHHSGSCPPVSDGTRPVCREAGPLISSGLGDPEFEDLFGLISGPVGVGNENMVATLAPYRSDDNLAGAAARVLTAKALLAWVARDPEGPPAELSPFDLLVEAIEIDPLASGLWWDAGNALLTLRDPLSGWILFETGRSLMPPENAGLLQQVTDLEDRLRTLAPEFFLPR